MTPAFWYSPTRFSKRVWTYAGSRSSRINVADVELQKVIDGFKAAGLPAFDLELEPTTAVRDMKKLARDVCNIEPEHMRMIYRGRELKDSDTLEAYDAEAEQAVQVLFTAGHTALVGGRGVGYPTWSDTDTFSSGHYEEGNSLIGSDLLSDIIHSRSHSCRFSAARPWTMSVRGAKTVALSVGTATMW